MICGEQRVGFSAPFRSMRSVVTAATKRGRRRVCRLRCAQRRPTSESTPIAASPRWRDARPTARGDEPASSRRRDVARASKRGSLRPRARWSAPPRWGICARAKRLATARNSGGHRGAPIAHRQALDTHGAPGAHRARPLAEQPISDPRGGAALGGGGRGATTRSGWGRSRGASQPVRPLHAQAPPRRRARRRLRPRRRGGRARREALVSLDTSVDAEARGAHHVVGAAGARRGADLRGVPEDGDLRRAAGADAAVGARRGAQGDRRRARARATAPAAAAARIDDDDDTDDGADGITSFDGGVTATDGARKGYSDGEWLQGLIQATHEMVRYAAGAATVGDTVTVEASRDAVSALHEALLTFDLRNGPLRKSYDGVKYCVRRLEELLYDLSLAGHSVGVPGVPPAPLIGGGRRGPLLDVQALVEAREGVRGARRGARALPQAVPRRPEAREAGHLLAAPRRGAAGLRSRSTRRRAMAREAARPRRAAAAGAALSGGGAARASRSSPRRFSSARGSRRPSNRSSSAATTPPSEGCSTPTSTSAGSATSRARSAATPSAAPPSATRPPSARRSPPACWCRQRSSASEPPAASSARRATPCATRCASSSS